MHALSRLIHFYIRSLLVFLLPTPVLWLDRLGWCPARFFVLLFFLIFFVCFNEVINSKSG